MGEDQEHSEESQTDPRRRIALLEEALARCLDWVTDQDVYPLDATDQMSWLEDIADLPSLAERDPSEVLAEMHRAAALVQRGVEVLGGPEAWRLAMARAEIRKRRKPGG